MFYFILDIEYNVAIKIEKIVFMYFIGIPL